MNRFVSASLVGCMSLVLTGALAGCHAGVDVDPPHSNTTTTGGGSTTVKKEVIRDANGNVVKEESHKSVSNP